MRCDLCPGKNNCVEPDGPAGNILFIGEAPGKDEDKKGVPFVGKTGREVNEHYLPLAGLKRSNVRFTNAIRCLPVSTGGKLDPTSNKDNELLKSCADRFLFPDIRRNHYRLIVPMGSFACRAIDPDISIDLDHGIPRRTKYGMAFPMFHPALGIHSPKQMLYIRTDWTRLRKYLRGTLNLPKDRFEGYEDYSEVESVEMLDEILSGFEDKVMACDTETMKGGTPFCVTFSITPGTGYLIRATNLSLLDRLQYHLTRWRGRLLWHNWPYDCLVVRKMGLVFPQRLIFDTMSTVFHLGNMAQGLKSLARRELGCDMTDFEDIVLPHSRIRALKYIRDMYAEDWPKPEPQLLRVEGGKFKLYKPHSLKTKLKVFYTYLAKNPDKDVFQAWENWEAEHEMIQERMGPFPGICISHAAEDNWPKVLHYACGDADKLLRLYPILLKMKSRVRSMVQENWRD